MQLMQQGGMHIERTLEKAQHGTLFGTSRIRETSCHAVAASVRSACELTVRGPEQLEEVGEGESTAYRCAPQ